MKFFALTRLLFALRNFAKRHLPLAAALCLLACSAETHNESAQDQQGLTTAIYRINCGGAAVSQFSADQLMSGGNTWTANVTVSTAGVSNAAPAAVYQSERYGNYAYTFGSLTPGASYTARLHFAETKWTLAGARAFNVIINGAQVLTNFDIFATAGINKALALDFNTTASSAGQISIQYVSVVDNAKSSGIEILSISSAPDAGGNQAPTVTTAATASANPVTGTTNALSVLGSDDAGEANLTYTWAATGAPPAAVSFSSNGSNAAKNTTATFTKAGSYTLVATIKDGSGSAVTSSVGVVVGQTFTSINVTPANVQIVAGGTQQFTASASDQFGSATASQPAVSWAASAGGTITSAGLFAATAGAGTFAITATSGVLNGRASVTVSGSVATGSPVYQINCGGPPTSPFAADRFASAGSAWATTTPVSTTGVANAAPPAVYQSERYGNNTYTFVGLTAGANYTVRLHFAENWWTSAGSRVFNVLINGAPALTNFDIFARAGASKALVLDFNATATSSGQIAIQYVSVVDQAKSSGIEILSGGGATNQAPTVATTAAASPNPVLGTTSVLSALGADDGGEPNLTYTWATTGSPPGSTSFSANGSNAAKTTSVTFSQAGSYVLAVTIRDPSGLSVSTSVSIAVKQTPTSLSVTPAAAQVASGGIQQFVASLRDQFGSAMASQPAMTWSVTGGGTISSSGLFAAGSSSGGPFGVSAASGGQSGSASITVSAGGPLPVTYSTNFDLTESLISEGGRWNTGLDPLQTPVSTMNGIAFGTQTGAEFASLNYNDSEAWLAGTFPPNQRASAVIHKVPGLTGGYQEVEILLRWSVGALRTGNPFGDTHSYGYEINLAWNGQYTQIARFKGPAMFDSLVSGSPITSMGVQDGDIFSAEIVGNTITSKLTRAGVTTVLGTATDNTGTPFASGTPGVGFYRGTNGGSVTNSTSFAFTSFAATSL